MSNALEAFIAGPAKTTKMRQKSTYIIDCTSDAAVCPHNAGNDVNAPKLFRLFDHDGASSHSTAPRDAGSEVRPVSALAPMCTCRYQQHQYRRNGFV